MPHSERPRLRNGRPDHDAKAPDGFTVGGWRKVHKGGYVRIVQAKHFHEKLADWVGQWVYVEIRDGFGVNADVWPDEPWKDSRTMLRCLNENDWNAP